ncbi:MAG: HlyD family efflux transporter periplasmic adaptor subunit, partial [Bdellovibrionales bacterium]|nr:HlyD family efflux transporter periplasmic adaptor subunit [Bdellovibrionales bacterium]
MILAKVVGNVTATIKHPSYEGHKNMLVQPVDENGKEIGSPFLSFDNANILFKRNKSLFDKGVISKQDFENSELSFNQAKQNLVQAQNDYQIIKKGSRAGSGSTANTNIVAQIPGTVLEIPVREGDQVIESNSFNAGTTIATIADMNKMIFEGKVDEAEVGKLNEG